MEGLILNAILNEHDTDKALSLLTPEIAKNGMVYGVDLFSLVTQSKVASMIKNNEDDPGDELWRQWHTLREKGYCFNTKSRNALKSYAKERDIPFFRLCMNFMRCYQRSDVLAMLFSVLNRAQLEPFFAKHTMLKSQEFLEFYPKEEAERHFNLYLTMQTAREKVREAAIGLIKCANQNTKAVMRIIARVVWAERGEEGWY